MGPKFTTSLVITPKLVILAHDIEVPMIIDFHSKRLCVEIPFFKKNHLGSKLNLIIILSFCVDTPIAIHALCHSCHPFPPFLVHVINSFIQIDCIPLMEIKVRPSQTLESFVQS
jgi:hypothetical protein